MEKDTDVMNTVVSLERVISDIVSNTIVSSTCETDILARIDKGFRAHMYRQIGLEYEIEQALQNFMRDTDDK